jgi:hypothetical protein
MAEAGLFSSIFSLAGAGFSAYGDIEAGEGKALGLEGQALSQRGQAKGYEFSALKSDRAAEYGRLNATQIGGQLTRDLNTTLGNLDAIRSAAHTDPSSPTGAAVRGMEEGIGIDQRNIKVGNVLAQASQSEADAAYYRVAATSALLGASMTEKAADRVGDAADLARTGGYTSAAGRILGSIGGLLASRGGAR